MGRRRSFLEPLLQLAGGSAAIRNTRNGRILADLVIPAFDSQSRNSGLLGRRAFQPGAALVLAPCNAVHTFFMKFPIDIVFATRDGRVLKVSRGVPAWRMAMSIRAFAVIELPGGTIDSCEIQVDDVLTIASLEAQRDRYDHCLTIH